MNRIIFALLAIGFATTTARALDPHVEAVIRIVEGARGKVEKTADGQGLKLVDLAVPGAGPHAHRQDDPYDAAFFEHLGHLASLESLNIIATKANDEWIAPIGKLKNLKTLKFTNNGKLTDAGLAKLAGLTNLEQFSYVGTGMKGHAFAKFTGWTRLTRCSFRGSSIDDEGVRLIATQFPQLESLVLAHARITDAGAAHLAKLTKLKGFELGSHNATPACLKNLAALPLEYLQAGEGVGGGAAVPFVKEFKTLKRLTLTDCKALTDDDLRALATMTHLESLELGQFELPAARVPVLGEFAFLKTLRLVRRPPPFPAGTQAAVKALLPKVELKFE